MTIIIFIAIHAAHTRFPPAFVFRNEFLSAPMIYVNRLQEYFACDSSFPDYYTVLTIFFSFLSFLFHSRFQFPRLLFHPRLSSFSSLPCSTRSRINWNVTSKTCSLALLLLLLLLSLFRFILLTRNLHGGLKEREGERERKRCFVDGEIYRGRASLTLLSALGWQLPVPNLHTFDIHACHSCDIHETVVPLNDFDTVYQNFFFFLSFSLSLFPFPYEYISIQNEFRTFVEKLHGI